jgi:hypothetical protein
MVSRRSAFLRTTSWLACLSLVGGLAASPWFRGHDLQGGTEFVPGPGPLACRFSVLSEKEQREASSGAWMDLVLPGFWTRRNLRNPLIGDLIRIEVRNTSDADVAIYECGSGASRPFRVDVQILDAKGRPARWPNRVPGEVKLLGPLPGITQVVTIAPGRSVLQRDQIWRSLTAANLPPPGDYDVRVVCSYDPAPDDRERRVESAPLRVKVTGAHIQEWWALKRAVENEPGREHRAPMPDDVVL